jgi:predicted transglutaminase-like cysteine proteinase
MYKRLRRCAVVFLAVAAAGAAALVQSAGTANAGFVPPGFHGFCKQFPAECRRKGAVVRAIALTPTREQQMQAVNREVNRKIRQLTDRAAFGRDELWTLPIGGKGDCEDLALLKRKNLIALGWPSSVLLMTVARDRRGDGHAVLTVVTDRGDFILDNVTSAIRLASATGYRYYVRQSSSDPKVWVTFTRGRRDVSAGLGAENMITDEDRGKLFAVPVRQADAKTPAAAEVAETASAGQPWVAQPPTRVPGAPVALERPAEATAALVASLLI